MLVALRAGRSSSWNSSISSTSERRRGKPSLHGSKSGSCLIVREPTSPRLAHPVSSAESSTTLRNRVTSAVSPLRFFSGTRFVASLLAGPVSTSVKMKRSHAAMNGRGVQSP